MTTCAGYANNNTLDKLLAASWTSLQLPVTVALPTLVFAGGVTYKPSWKQRILVVQSGHAPGLIATGWQVLMSGDASGGVSFLQCFLDNGWKLTPEGGLDGSNV
jgi:hypothetical protein